MPNKLSEQAWIPFCPKCGVTATEENTCPNTCAVIDELEIPHQLLVYGLKACWGMAKEFSVLGGNHYYRQYQAIQAWLDSNAPTSRVKKLSAIEIADMMSEVASCVIAKTGDTSKQEILVSEKVFKPQGIIHIAGETNCGVCRRTLPFHLKPSDIPIGPIQLAKQLAKPYCIGCNLCLDTYTTKRLQWLPRGKGMSLDALLLSSTGKGQEFAWCSQCNSTCVPQFNSHSPHRTQRVTCSTCKTKIGSTSAAGVYVVNGLNDDDKNNFILKREQMGWCAYCTAFKPYSYDEEKCFACDKLVKTSAGDPHKIQAWCHKCHKWEDYHFYARRRLLTNKNGASVDIGSSTSPDSRAYYVYYHSTCHTIVFSTKGMNLEQGQQIMRDQWRRGFNDAESNISAQNSDQAYLHGYDTYPWANSRKRK